MSDMTKQQCDCGGELRRKRGESAQCYSTCASKAPQQKVVPVSEQESNRRLAEAMGVSGKGGAISSNEYLGLDRDELRAVVRERDSEIERLRAALELFAKGHTDSPQYPGGHIYSATCAACNMQRVAMEALSGNSSAGETSDGEPCGCLFTPLGKQTHICGFHAEERERYGIPPLRESSQETSESRLTSTASHDEGAA